MFTQNTYIYTNIRSIDLENCKRCQMLRMKIFLFLIVLNGAEVIYDLFY